MSIYELDGVIRPYPWGSRTSIPALLGRPPGGEPAAELWLGAHPDAPARVPAHGTTLEKLIASDPEGLLGRAVVDRFGPQLPFLLKVLAAETALSIQVHPNLAQARAGFAAEDAQGVPRESPARNYRDANHKPELLCALTEFDALCGFRPVDATLRLLDALGVDALAPYRERLARTGVRTAFTALLELDEPASLVDSVVAALPGLADTEWAALGAALRRVAGDFPRDRGIAVALLLNFVRLAPGEAIFLGAGNVHAYLHGTGVEIMANSDNVLRCGLTRKHIDVAELVRITDFSQLADPRWPDEGTGFGHDFRVPVADFALRSVDLDAYQPAGRYTTEAADKPSVVLCTSGAVTVGVPGASVDLRPGRAAFVPAREATFTLGGAGETYLATVGDLAQNRAHTAS
jgi:mannose-6-phosphate isomerase